MFAFGGMELVDMAFAEYSVQDNAQAIAVYEGHYGGCTPDENSLDHQYINDFCQKQNLNAAQASISDNRPNQDEPVSYGANITVTLTVPYDLPFLGAPLPDIKLTGVGRSVSSYIPGMIPVVTYTSP